MNYEKTIAKIKESLQFGDIAEISKSTGVSRTTIGRVFHKTSSEKLTATEQRVFDAAVDLIKKRREKMKAAQAL